MTTLANERALWVSDVAHCLPGFIFRRRMAADGGITYPAFRGNLSALLGFAPEEMGVNAKGCLHVVHWADRDAHLDEIRRSAKTLTPCAEEFRAISKSGELFWLRGASQPHRQPDGSVEWEGVLIDVSDARRAELRLDLLMEHACDSILLLDGDGRINTVNASAERLFGWRPAELTGMPFSRLLANGEDVADSPAVGAGPRELIGVHKDGSHFPLEVSTNEVRMEGHRLFVVIGRDISHRKEAEQRLSFLAFHDPLTHLPNHASFLERFAPARDNAVQVGAPLAVLSLGIDRFGAINAVMGHAVGDRVLIAAAAALAATLGHDDVLARAAGDRFTVLIAGRRSVKDVLDAAEHMHAAVKFLAEVEGEEVELSASSGLALFPRDGDNVETLIRRSEMALQQAKNSAPGTLRVFCEEISAHAAKTLTVQARLRRAIDQGELEPYYQPQVDLASGHVVGMEALVRWNSPDLGMVPPAEFIPIAEESGLIDGVCELMLTRCADQNKAWQDAGLSAIPVAINVSGRQFQSARRLVSVLESTLQRSKLAPRFLEVELTESSAMRDADNAIAVVHTLKDMGIPCAIDDFGTGYSSLSVLKRFPISKLKIDRSFVMDVITDSNDAAIVEAILAMARALRMKVVAEGVEYKEHLEFLRGLGCDQIQGYFFSRPLPADRMETLLRTGQRLEFASA